MIEPGTSLAVVTPTWRRGSNHFGPSMQNSPVVRISKWLDAILTTSFEEEEPTARTLLVVPVAHNYGALVRGSNSSPRTSHIPLCSRHPGGPDLKYASYLATFVCPSSGSFVLPLFRHLIERASPKLCLGPPSRSAILVRSSFVLDPRGLRVTAFRVKLCPHA